MLKQNEQNENKNFHTYELAFSRSFKLKCFFLGIRILNMKTSESISIHFYEFIKRA